MDQRTIENSSKDIKQKHIITVLFIVYILINVILACCHEPWRDEAQAWLISRDLSPWGIVQLMKYEGHPCLWHFIIYPLAHFGAPYWSQRIVSLLIMGATTGLFLYKAPFPVYIKGLIAISPALTYYYPVISRSYCLIPLFLFMAAYYYPDRKDRPFRYTLAIALLVHTHVIMIMTCFVLSLAFLIEGIRLFRKDTYRARQIILALFLPFISAVVLVLELANVNSSSAYNIHAGSITELAISLLKAAAAIPFALCGLTLRLRVVVIICAAALILAAVYLIKRHDVTGITVITTWAATMAFQLWVYAAVFDGNRQRYLTLIIVAIWGLWLLRDKRQGLSVGGIALAVTCCMVLYGQLGMMLGDITSPYSNAGEAARYIQSNIAEDAVLLADNEPAMSAILPYLDNRQAVFAPNSDRFTYVVWNGRQEEVIPDSELQKCIDKEDTGKGIYIVHSLTGSHITDFDQAAGAYELVYKSKSPSLAGDEDFEIYRVK